VAGAGAGIGQGAARRLFTAFVRLALAASAALAREVGDGDGHLAVVAVHEVLPQPFREGLELAQHVAIARGQVHLQVAADTHSGRAVVVAALDNLVKGAAGQAVQNANLVLGLAETAGLPVNGVAP